MKTHHERPKDQPTRKAAPPQAPVVVLGRETPFLDVQETVLDAEDHLGVEHVTGGPAVDACDYYDGLARPLRPVLGADRTVALRVAPGGPQPDLLRQRANAHLRWARDRYEAGDLPEGAHVDTLDDLEPLPEEYSFARFLCVLDERFNGGLQRHVGGRLHNFWHAITG